jgi:hypothetical protein
MGTQMRSKLLRSHIDKKIDVVIRNSKKLRLNNAVEKMD